MVEMAPLGDDCYRMGFAGDTFNTAWYGRRLLPDNWSVGYGTCVGTDSTSDRMVAFMQAAGVDTGAIRRLPGQTVGLYMIHLRDGERGFSYWRGQSAARDLADDPVWLRHIMADADVIYFSGITLAVLADGTRDALCTALATARRAGKHIVFDTNMRPRLWPGLDAMRAGIMAGAGVADIVLPSFDEEAETFGDTSQAQTAARYAGAGAGLVIVKNRAEPLLALADRSDEMWFSPSRVAMVADTTAAGDSFAAGFMARYFNGATLDEAVQLAMTTAAQVVQENGALVPIPARTEPAGNRRPNR